MSDPTLTREAVVEALDSPRLNNFKEYNTLAALCRQQHELLECIQDGWRLLRTDYNAPVIIGRILALMPTEGVGDGTE